MQVNDKKQLEAIKTLSSSAGKFKHKLQELLFKLETQGDCIEWPNYLSTLGVCASELNEMRKFIESERFTGSDSLVLTPILLNPEPDPVLAKATEERLSVFNHDTAPQYLRTRLDPHIEAQRNTHLKRASSISPEVATKLVTLSNRVLDSSLKEVAFLKQELDSDLADRQTRSQTSDEDLRTLVGALALGRGFTSLNPMLSGQR